MLLIVDCGNTNTVFALYDGEQRRRVWRTTTNEARTADEYAVWLTQLMWLDEVSTKDVEGAIIACVVPAAMFGLKRLCLRYFELEPLVVGEPSVDLQLSIKMDRPEQVGADRLVNAFEAHRRYGGPLVVVAFGTATSFDYVDGDGNYAGGVLAPGVNLSVEALYMHAAKLPRISIERPDRVIGKATVPGMQSGIYWGYVAMTEGIIARMEQEVGQELTVVATGGLAELFADATDVIDHIDRDLTLRGLAHLYMANRPGTAGA